MYEDLALPAGCAGDVARDSVREPADWMDWDRSFQQLAQDNPAANGLEDPPISQLVQTQANENCLYGSENQGCVLDPDPFALIKHNLPEPYRLPKSVTCARAAFSIKEVQPQAARTEIDHPAHEAGQVQLRENQEPQQGQERDAASMQFIEIRVVRQPELQQQSSASACEVVRWKLVETDGQEHDVVVGKRIVSTGAVAFRPVGIGPELRKMPKWEPWQRFTKEREVVRWLKQFIFRNSEDSVSTSSHAEPSENIPSVHSHQNQPAESASPRAPEQAVIFSAEHAPQSPSPPPRSPPAAPPQAEVEVEEVETHDQGNSAGTASQQSLDGDHPDGNEPAAIPCSLSRRSESIDTVSTNCAPVGHKNSQLRFDSDEAGAEGPTGAHAELGHANSGPVEDEIVPQNDCNVVGGAEAGSADDKVHEVECSPPHVSANEGREQPESSCEQELELHQPVNTAAVVKKGLANGRKRVREKERTAASKGVSHSKGRVEPVLHQHQDSHAHKHVGRTVGSTVGNAEETLKSRIQHAGGQIAGRRIAAREAQKSASQSSDGEPLAQKYNAKKIQAARAHEKPAARPMQPPKTRAKPKPSPLSEKAAGRHVQPPKTPAKPKLSPLATKGAHAIHKKVVEKSAIAPQPRAPGAGKVSSPAEKKRAHGAAQQGQARMTQVAATVAGPSTQPRATAAANGAAKRPVGHVGRQLKLQHINDKAAASQRDAGGVTLVPQKKHNRPPPQRKRTSVSIADSDTCSSSDSHDRSNSRSAAVSSTSDDFAADEAQTDRKRKRETLQPGASERSAPPIRRKTTQARDHGHDSWRHRWETRGHMCALDAPSHSVPMRELYSHQSTLHIDLENRTAWQEITVPCSGEDAAAYHVLRKACASYMKECSVVTNIEEVPDKVGNVVVSFQIPSVILKSLPQLQEELQMAEEGAAGSGSTSTVHTIQCSSIWALGVVIAEVMEHEPLKELFVTKECRPQLLVEVLQLAEHLKDNSTLKRVHDWMHSIFALLLSSCQMSSTSAKHISSVSCMTDLLLEVPPEYSIFSFHSFHAKESNLPYAPMEDVLQLPPPLCMAWFQAMHSITLRLDFSTPDAELESFNCLSSIPYASELKFLSIEVVSNAADDCRDAHRANHGALNKASCSFQRIKHCLLGKPALKELQLHGVDILPADLLDFTAIIRTGLSHSLKSLTLCRTFGKHGAYKTHEKGMIFTALKNLDHLHTLVIPDLSDFLRSSMVTEHISPLKSLPALNRICVRAKDRVALLQKMGVELCQSLNFEALPEEGCHCSYSQGDD